MANHAAGALCPALAEMVTALQAVIPELRGNIGTTRSDGSRHTAGLAADIMLDSKNPYQKGIGDDIIDALIALQGQIRWHDIIYTDWIDDGSGGPPRVFHFHIPGGGGGYGGRRLEKNPVDRTLGQAHENHIHVDWVDFSLRIVPHETTFVYNWPPDAMSTGFAAALMGMLMLSSRL